jgi:hypothetical protein
MQRRQQQESQRHPQTLQQRKPKPPLRCQANVPQICVLCRG